MAKKIIAEINGEKFEAFIEEGGKYVSIHSVEDEDDPIFMGRFELDGDNLVEFYPMTNTRIVIGKLVKEDSDFNR